MKAVHSLPAHYREIYQVNLQKDKKAAVLVNGLALLIAAAMVIPMGFSVPIVTLFDGENGLRSYLIKVAVLVVSMIVYMVLHELVHGITMKTCGTKKVKYGFTGMYAFAGSEDYYDKSGYIAVALAPIVVFAVVFTAACLLVPRDWFWVAYLLQVCNISGAAGDLFVTVRFAKMPADILVKDIGVGMTVYSGQA